MRRDQIDGRDVRLLRPALNTVLDADKDGSEENEVDGFVGKLFGKR